MFVLEFLGWRGGNLNGDQHKFNRLVCPDGNISTSGECSRNKPPEDGKVSIEEYEIRPDYSYSVAIEIKNYQVDQKSEIRLGNFSSKAGIPETPLFKEATVQATDIPSSSATVILQIQNLNEKNGLIEWSALLISQVGCDDEDVAQLKVADFCSELKPCPKSRSWSDVAHADCVKQYQTTNEQWNIASIREEKEITDQNTIHYTIGTDKCAVDKQEYCNGPLKPNTEYNVTLRIFTKNSYRDIHIITFTTGECIQRFIARFMII